MIFILAIGIVLLAIFAITIFEFTIDLINDIKKDEFL